MKLFESLPLRSVTLRNRLAVSPMCQYSARDGFASDYHLVHLGRFAMGGFGLVMVEATAVLPEGRITHGDLGLWSDAHVDGLARIATALKASGAVAAIQLAHAGPKAASQRPWEGNGPLSQADFDRGEDPWPVVSASDKPYADGWLKPTALTRAMMDEVKAAFVAATSRALAAGFDVVEVHCAHGYLLNSFLSPVTNNRIDEYGSDIDGRMRFPLEVVEAVRNVMPDDKPLFVRVSAVDGLREGMSIDDTVEFARRLKTFGVDVVDCSSGGIAPRYEYPSSYGYQVPYASRVRAEVGISTAAVGLIVDAHQAEAVVADDHADIVAIGREALVDPNFPLHAEAQLGAADPANPYGSFPVQATWWLQGRANQIRQMEAATSRASADS
ncbi:MULTISPECIES: NADH:flavin oxidoreductase/NADH oxidase [Rhodopseudomonas]|uniref:NADH:flavin oxidoreductase / NADH oxidase n=1 Tax=Rhodopseudomonas palustris TaxID=1076 RepID=A0A0D7F492_RHOPL|nr:MULTISPECIES: NADH:flavin oxidoreductase/NADH oxidase [Rhodopseudomonas]KIZ47630.1 NADH:flavin oxidoreductase / NADH oxidase [Rhodopseudomonas palustris]MDF3811211.1 NADH:flavin oxidoreductase/NADH oxidase [Rhodopseudomonas sp. BAL398]WOK19541.1 NADH:flavin oxidoreductase/NADH oxidase [Rhodopseudomonas sp. BAL398]